MDWISHKVYDVNDDRVIAHFRPRKAWGGIFVMMLCVLFVPYMTFVSFSGHLIQRLEGRPFLFPLLVSMWASALIVLAMCATMVRRMLFNHGRALWLQGGTLIYIHRLFFSVQCAEISRFSKGTTGRMNGDAIIIQLRSGGTKDLPTGSLLELRDQVIHKLNAALEFA
jgi:hypothetical protein